MGQKCSVTWSVVCAQRLEQRPTSGDPRPCVSVCVRGGNCKIRHTAAAAAAASVTAVIQAFFSILSAYVLRGPLVRPIWTRTRPVPYLAAVEQADRSADAAGIHLSHCLGRV